MTKRHPYSVSATAGQAHLRVLATTDIHASILPYDYFTDAPTNGLGLTCIAAVAEAARAEAANTLTLDNGDFLQGNPLADYVAYEKGAEGMTAHPVLRAMSAMGIEAAALGNHEFNYGLGFLEAALAVAEFPVVSANVLTARGATPLEDRTLLPPYVILERSLTDGAGRSLPIRIGVIGFVAPQIVLWDRRHLEGRIESRDILETARAWVPELRRAGADIVIALSHSGFGAVEPAPGDENVSAALAQVPGIDALIAGHTHQIFPGPGFEGHPLANAAAGLFGRTPAVMPGFWGSHLGLIDLLLGREGDRWQVLGAQVSVRAARPTATAVSRAAAAVRAAAEPEHSETLSYIRRPVGRTTVPLTTYFALVSGTAALQLVADAQRDYIARMLKGTAREVLPVLSATAPFKAGGRAGPDFYTDIPAGELALKNIADLYYFPNTIRAVEVTGAELRGWLERAAGLFNHIRRGVADQMLIDPAFSTHNFDVIHGIRYRIDPSAPSRFDRDGALVEPGAQRITELLFEGRPVRPDERFVVATNNYRADGSGAFPGARSENIIFEGPDTNRDIVIRHVLEHGAVDPSGPSSWSFEALPGTSVIFESGPRAIEHLATLQDLDVEPAGQGANGFMRFRLRL